MDATAEAPARAGRREKIALAVLALPTILVAMDISVLYLALPHVGGDLGANSVQQLWITDIYGFMVAGLLVTMGNLGDRIGRKRLLLIGAFGFAVTSVLAAWSNSPEMLIASRALLGIFGSTLMPSIMALISVMFTDPKQHTMAITVWMGCFIGGTALGPIIGGVILQFFWWGAVFLVAVPVMLLLLVFGPALLPEYRNPKASHIDLISVVLSLLAILPFVYGLKQISWTGAAPVPITAIVVGIIAALLFLRRQSRLDNPLLDLKLFQNGTFSSALTMTMFAGLVAGNQLFVYQYMQSVEELSPAVTALWMLPSAFASVLAMQVTPLLTRTIRPAFVIAGGLLIAVAGYILMTQLHGTRNLPLLVFALVLASIGIGPMGSMCAVLAMQSAPPERAGSAAAMTSTAGEFGIAMSVAVLGTVGNAVYRNVIDVPGGIPAEAAASARESLAGALESARQLPGDQAAALLRAAYEAIASSVHSTAIISAALLVAAAVLSVTTLRHLPASGQQQPPAEATLDEVAIADRVGG